MAANPSYDTEIPTKEQINRLKALQGVDCGVFTLAIFSAIEAFLKSKLKNRISYSTSFEDIMIQSAKVEEVEINEKSALYIADATDNKPYI